MLWFVVLSVDDVDGAADDGDGEVAVTIVAAAALIDVVALTSVVCRTSFAIFLECLMVLWWCQPHCCYYYADCHCCCSCECNCCYCSVAVTILSGDSCVSGNCIVQKIKKNKINIFMH